MHANFHLLSTHLKLILGAPLLAAVLTGCDTDSTWTLIIANGETCPSVDEINEQYMPTGPQCGGSSVLWVEDLQSQTDYQGWYGDTGGVPTEDACTYTAVRRNTVRASACVEGRPLRQHGEAQVAQVVTGPSPSPWVHAGHPQLAGLSAHQREALGRFWLTSALYEHASIGSFSVFTLDLLAHGAPPELLARAQVAAGDEVRHARDCFTMASAYAGTVISPGALTTRPEPALTLADLAEAVARDAAINETLAAVQAAEQLARATDPTVRAVLANIVADEARHAELAWATLRWLLEIGGDGVRTRLVDVFADATPPTLDDHPELAVPSHGLLDRETLAGALTRALEQVVRPAAEALLAS
jgi:hypothetical protein